MSERKRPNYGAYLSADDSGNAPLDGRDECARYKPQNPAIHSGYYLSGVDGRVASAPQMLFVVAAGTDGSSVQATNPATRFALPNSLLVGAVDQRGAKSTFTNVGPEIGIYASGVGVSARQISGAVSPAIAAAEVP